MTEDFAEAGPPAPGRAPARRGRRGLAAALAAGLVLACGGGEQGAPADLLIAGGQVLDGTGSAAEPGAVAVRGDSLVHVGPGGAPAAPDTLDASGLVVAPGFVDAHNHTAPAVAEPERRRNEGFLRQGVTTVAGGPDGALGPRDMRELIAAYREQGIGTNVSLYVGHNGIRDSVVGTDTTVTDAEMERMKAAVREGMELGALGLSTGLMYEPGMFSATGEVVELASVAAAHGGIYDSHVRDPVHDLLGSDREVIQIADRAGIPGKIGHLKAVGLKNEGRIRAVIALVEDARSRGLEIVSDQYPYDGAATGTLEEIVVVPDSLRGREGFDLERALEDPAARRSLERASEQGIDGGFAWVKAVGYGSMRVVSSPSVPEIEGRYLSRLAQERGRSPFDLVAELILSSDRPVRITYGAIREEDVRALLDEPWNMIASDGGWTDGSDAPEGHPRSAGTFPRLLGHYVREEGVLSLPEAVRKITSLPARFLGLSDRGVLREGKAADVVVFDPEEIAARSTWSRPQRHARGVVHLLVNGTPVIRDEQLTGAAPGRYLPRNR